jgi:outer membrane protein OmpA-like peptidoglycan-associated protein
MIEPALAPVPQLMKLPTMPAPQMPAPIPAVEMPVLQSYIVFFDFDKAMLTPAAKRILASAAADYKGGQYVRVVVKAHTDTSGTRAYNEALSKRRARSVHQELERLNVPSQVIISNTYGERMLMVPTTDGVREAQNRRAEIILEQ